jgi:branched-chain amino acid transport system substrate-binding protein
MKPRPAIASMLAAVAIVVSASSPAAETIRIAHIDPMSGPFAVAGTALGHHMYAAADAINARGGVLGGVKLEIVLFDSKSNPQEATLALKQVIDQGIRYVTQGAGSNVAHALSEAVAKHNNRNPDASMMGRHTFGKPTVVDGGQRSRFCERRGNRGRGSRI